MPEDTFHLQKDFGEQSFISDRQVFLNTTLQALHEISLLISKGLNREKFLNSLPSILVLQGGHKMSWMILLNPDRSVGSCEFAGQAGYPNLYETFTGSGKIPPCIAPMVGKTSCQVIDPFPAFNPEEPERTLAGYVYPLRIKRQLTGFLVVAFSRRFVHDEQHRQFFEEIGLDVTTALYHDHEMLKLRESEGKFRVLFERSADAQLIMKGDVFIECNEAMSTILGAESRESLVGITPWEVSPEFQPDGKNTREKGLGLIKQVEEGHSVRFEWMHLKFDGSEAPVEVSLTPVSFGSESFIHVAMRDISDRLKAEKKLYVANQLFQIIMANSPDIIWIRDMNLNLTTVSKSVERIKGYTPEEAIQRDLQKMVTPATYQMYLNNLEEEAERELNGSFDPARIRRYESDEVGKDGSIIHTESLASFIRDEKGLPTGMLGITRDITEQQQIFLELEKAKEKAEESDLLKSAFLANMSHEIRTPMNSILGFAELLGEENLDRKERKKYIEIIQSGTSQLLSIISDIIDISKIQAGQVVLHPEPVDLSKLFEEIHSKFLFDLERQNKSRIAIKRSCSCHLLQDGFLIDPGRLNQIMGNLISNAIKFTQEGSIEFGCTHTEGFRRFFVKDTGKGIPEEYQGIIFERFRQVEESLTRTYTGTGLGLAICQGLVTLMGGSMGVISAVGEGSEFWFTIPEPR